MFGKTQNMTGQCNILKLDSSLESVLTVFDDTELTYTKIPLISAIFLSTRLKSVVLKEYGMEADGLKKQKWIYSWNVKIWVPKWKSQYHSGSDNTTLTDHYTLHVLFLKSVGSF